jgi:hypothetical protein
MLKPEQARAALEKLRLEDWQEHHLATAAGLPAGLRPLGYLILECDPEGKPFKGWAADREAWGAADKQLDELPEKSRLKLFEALFPKVFPHVAAGWELLKRMPYEAGYLCKAFRAPHTPRASRAARCEWLRLLAHGLLGYRQDITWYAAWAAHFGGYGWADALGRLFAAAIDGGGREGEAVFDILCASARGEHEIGAMGRHVTRGLLASSRPDGWEFVEKLLLAAQRQEGLRQTILETIDEAHSEAFRRMLRLILEHDLARFSSTVRAVDVWFGYQWDAVSVRVVNQVIERVLQFLEEPEARGKGLDGDDAETAYLALWAAAFEDAVATVKPAARLLSDANVERRFVAAHLLAQLELPEARRALLPALEDGDLRVVLRALEGCHGDDDEREPAAAGDLFERVERVLGRISPKKVHLQPIVWPWQVLTADPQAVAGDLVAHLRKRPPTRLLPHLPVMETWTKAQVIDRLAKIKKWDTPTRDTLFALAGDVSGTVRESAIKALARCQVTGEEAARLESLLTRKAGDLRRGVLALLLNQKDEAALASGDRLLAASAQLQRTAGLELLRELAAAGRVPDQCRARAEAYRARTEHQELGRAGRRRQVRDPRHRPRAAPPVRRRHARPGEEG